MSLLLAPQILRWWRSPVRRRADESKWHIAHRANDGTKS